jgi:hypothetical protein
MGGGDDGIVVEIDLLPDDFNPLEGFGRMLRKLRELDAPSRARRVRRLSFREAAKQAGRPIASVTDRPDGSRTYAFGEPDAAPVEEPPPTSLFKARAIPKMKVVL